METHFEGIKTIVIKEIESAEFVIYVAVAWITDHDIIAALTKKLISGTQVEIVVNGDKQFSKVKARFNEFLLHGGKLSLYENNDKSIMHNKFCVIDLNTTITGSFNWSFHASTYHKENIVIERNNSGFARDFAKEFFRLKKASVLFDRKYVPYDSAVYAEAEVVQEFREDGFEQYCVVEVSEKDRNRVGVLFVYGCENCWSLPDKIFGVWIEHSKWTTYSAEKHGIEEPAFLKNKPVYGFDCLDSRLSSYRVESA